MNDELITVSQKTRWAYTTYITAYVVTIAGVDVLKSEASGETDNESAAEAESEVRTFLKQLALSALAQLL